MGNPENSGRTLENLKENITLYHDDRTGFVEDVNDLVEDEYAPGVYTLPEFSDIQGFNEMKSANPKDKYDHNFRT